MDIIASVFVSLPPTRKVSKRHAVTNAVAGHNGLWIVSHDEAAEAEFDALRQRQRAAAHEDFSSQALTTGET